MAPHMGDSAQTTTLEDFMPDNLRRDKKISSPEEVTAFLIEQAAILNARPMR